MTSRLPTSSQTGITAGGAQLAAAGLSIAQVRVRRDQDQVADLTDWPGKTQAGPGQSKRPEGRGRKPIIETQACVAGVPPHSRRHRELASGTNPRLVAGRRIGAAWNVLRSHLATLPALNFCGDLRRWSFPSRFQPAKQPRGVFTVCFGPTPSVRVAFHKRQSNQGWTACLTKGFPKSVKEFPRTI